MAFWTKKAAIAPLQCWACGGQVGLTDNFCPHCGTWNPLHKSESIHARLVSIEKLMLKTIIGVGALIFLVGWAILQMFHFETYYR